MDDTSHIETSEITAELLAAVTWIETASERIAEKIDAPADIKRHGLVEIMVVSHPKRGVQVDVHLTMMMHKSLACQSAPTLVEAVQKTRAMLREKGLE